MNKDGDSLVRSYMADRMFTARLLSRGLTVIFSVPASCYLPPPPFLAAAVLAGFGDPGRGEAEQGP